MVKGDNSLFFSTALDNSGLKQGTFNAVGIIRGLASKIAKINPFAALAVGAVAAFAAIANESFKMARGFETAMKEVQTISSAVQQDFEGISSKVFDLTQITPDNPEQVANAFYQIVSAGIDGAEGLRLLEVASKAAVAGVTDTATAADGITTILNAFKLSTEQSEAVSDSLFNTVKLGKTTFEELASQISQVAPIAAASNIPLNEILSTVASLTKQGVPTAQAMTQIRSAIVGLNESGRLDGTKTFQENMQALYDTFNGNQTAIQGEVGRIEAVQAILSVSGRNAKAANEDLLTYNDTIGASQKAFATMAKSNQNQWDILGNRIKATTKGIGDTVLELSSGIAGYFNDILEGGNFTASVYNKEIENLNRLKFELQDTLIEEDRRVQIIDELQKKYPQFLANIDSEKASYDDLLSPLTLINEQLLTRIRIENNKDKIGDLDENATKAYEERRIAVQGLEQEIDKLRDTNLSFAEGVSDRGEVSFLDRYQEVLQVASTDNTLKKLSAGVVFFADEIKKAESERNINQKELNALLGVQKDLTDGIVDKTSATTPDAATPIVEEDGETYEDFLNKRKEDYEAYENFVIALGKQKADERFNTLLREGKDYGDFLEDQLDKAQTFAKERAVIDAAADARIVLNRKPIEKVELAVDVQPIVQDIVIDETSVNAITRRLNALNADYRKSKDDTEKSVLADKIRVEKEKLDAANRFLQEEEGLYDDLQRSISDLRNKELRNYIKLWQEKLNIAEKGSKAAAEAEGKILDAQEQIGINTQSTIQEIGGVLREAGSLFSKFGNEEIAGLLNQLSDVAGGVSTLAAGIASNNPLAIAQGVLAVASSAVTVEVVSDTSKFQAVIDDLEKSISRLDDVISSSLGQDRISSRVDAIDDLKKLQEEADKAKEAELNARKEVRLLGITISKKSDGSGTDASKLEELEQTALDAKNRVEELQNELNELFTGATQSSLSDSIIDGFKEGKRSAEDFADTFEDLMRNAIFESLKIKYLEKASNDFFEQFGALAGDEDGLTADDISNLSNVANNIFNASIKELDQLNAILEEAGIAGGVFGESSRSNSLAGSISTITEDTANILSGTLNSIRLDISSGLAIAEQSSLYLARIASNTDYNRFLETIDLKLGEINSAFSNFEAQGS